MTGNIQKRRGYEAETAVAKELGIERIAGSGRRDLDGGWFSAEVKERAKPAQWLEAAMLQSERLSRPDQLALVVIHWLGARHADDLVVMRLSEFRDYFGSRTVDS